MVVSKGLYKINCALQQYGFSAENLNMFLCLALMPPMKMTHWVGWLMMATSPQTAK